MKPIFFVTMLLAAAPAAAQSIELAPLVIYSTSASIDMRADGVDNLEIDDGLTWGARGAYFVTEHFGLEGLWTYQSTGLMMASGSNTAQLFEMTVNQLFANAVYQLGSRDAPLRPFLFGGAGATFFAAPEQDGDVKPTWNVGGGVKWFPQQRFGIEGRYRYRPTVLNASDDQTCGPFGFCQGSLKHSDITVGAIFRF